MSAALTHVGLLLQTDRRTESPHYITDYNISITIIIGVIIIIYIANSLRICWQFEKQQTVGLACVGSD